MSDQSLKSKQITPVSEIDFYTSAITVCTYSLSLFASAHQKTVFGTPSIATPNPIIDPLYISPSHFSSSPFLYVALCHTACTPPPHPDPNYQFFPGLSLSLSRSSPASYHISYILSPAKCPALPLKLLFCIDPGSPPPPLLGRTNETTARICVFRRRVMCSAKFSHSNFGAHFDFSGWREISGGRAGAHVELQRYDPYFE